MTTPRRTLTAVLASVALCGSLAGCDFSKTGAVRAGAPDVVTVLPLTFGSTTTLTFDPATTKALASLQLQVAGVGSAVAQSLGGPGLAFPITTGYAEVHTDRSKTGRAGASAAPGQVPAAVSPGWIQGSLYHEGSGIAITGRAAESGTGPLTAQAPQAVTVVLSDFVVDPGNSVLYGTVDGALPQVPLLFLDGSRLSVTAANPGAVGGTFADTAGDVTLGGTVARLTPQAAQLLDTTFGTSALTAGTELGTVQVALTGEPVSYIASEDHVSAFSRLTGDGTTVTLDPATASALSSIGVTPQATGTATLSGGAVTFPITGGMVAVHSQRGFNPGYVVGSVLHQGSGLAFDGADGATVATGDYVVDPGGSILYATVNGARNVPLLILDGSKLTVDASGGTVTLDGTVARLTSQAAGALDSTLGTGAFHAGMTLGTVHLVARGLPGS